MTAEQILKKALQLNEEERAVLANSLLDSIEVPPSDCRSDAELIVEIEQRARVALEGGSGLTWADSRTRIENHLHLR